MLIRQGLHDDGLTNEALRLLGEVLGSVEQGEDRELLRRAKQTTGCYWFRAGGVAFFDQANAWFEESLTLSKELSSKEGEAQALYYIGTIHQRRGEANRKSISGVQHSPTSGGLGRHRRELAPAR